jgi:LysM repeat protein
VQSGDTLSAIADKYDLTIDHLVSLNGLSRNGALRIGQQLQLTGEPRVDEKPTEPKSEVTAKDIHVVKSGETLSSIARKYYLQLNYLADLNGLKQSSTVRVGQQLKVNLPPEIAAKANNIKPAAKTTVASNTATEAYTVKAGESLNAIASRMGMTASNLAEMNNLSARAGLRVGQSIQIPKLVTDYKIRRGDTMIGLASRHGVDTDALAKMNNIQPNAQLRIGDVIKVPN